VRLNIWHLKAGSSEPRNGNSNRRASGPPGRGLEHGAHTPNFVKTFPVEKPKVTSWRDLRIQPGNLNGSQKRKNDWNMATQNVRNLFRAAALRNTRVQEI